MTSTLQSTIVQVLGCQLPDAANIDGREEFNLTDAQRKELVEECVAVFVAASDEILKPYGCTMLGNGDIILIDIDDNTVTEWDQEGVREQLSMIDVTERSAIFGKYDAMSTANDARLPAA